MIGLGKSQQLYRSVGMMRLHGVKDYNQIHFHGMIMVDVTDGGVDMPVQAGNPFGSSLRCGRWAPDKLDESDGLCTSPALL